MTKQGLNAIREVIRSECPWLREIEVEQFTSKIATALYEAEAKVKAAVNAA